MDSAAVGAILNVLFDRLASRELLNFFRGRKDEEKLLKKLKIKLLGVKPLLNDAELKQWTDPAIKDWMDELKDVIYHADDLLDEIATEAMRSKLDSEYSTSSSSSTTVTQAVRDLVSWSPFGEGIASRIEDIIKRLEYFVDAKESLGLRQVDVGWNNPSHRLPQTASLVDHVSVYGRDDDKQKIIQLLISDDDSSRPQLSVIPIVGMGGIGKTTLVQLVYNDPKVIQRFEEKIWACVSEEFDILRVTKTILLGLSLSCSSDDDLNTLQVKLRGRLAGKKFLIVLDDVWNENYDDWDRLRSPFGVGKRGSTIIVTTRNKGVASIMQTVPDFHLEQLSNEDCWLLFSKHAFENVSPSVQSNLEKMGRQIVEKCKGLPLAAKTLAGILRNKVEVEEWVNVLESHLWDLPKQKSHILPVLLLSYHHLPSHLKLCFAYCAIIPKDYAFEKDELVALWIAQGLVEQPRGNRRIESIGDNYFCELTSRSFFQQSNYGNNFLMHDLINDLAQFVAGKYLFRYGDDHQPDLSKVRYFSHFQHCGSDVVEEWKAISEAISEANYLRTFHCFTPDYQMVELKGGYLRRVDEKVLDHLLLTLRCLRVLSLINYSIDELPDSIGNLIHLRYLNLSYTDIKCLPETICRLCNLETLLLRGCRELTTLPTFLCKLICLRHLDIRRTKLTEMPMQISKLRNLQCLTNFIVGNQTGSAISELRELCHLRGTLSISNLENVNDVRDALETNLKNKKHIEELNLEWVAEHTDDSQKEREVLEKLQPHVNLKYLTIINYGGTRFPDWLGDYCSFSNIKSLCLRNCSNCLELPPLGQLPLLQELTIEGMDSVKKVGSEFYEHHHSARTKPFHSLEKLSFYEMPEWEEWSILGAGEFCNLVELRIWNCPKLVSIGAGGLLPAPNLSRISIESCKKLKALPEQMCTLLPSLQLLRLCDLPEIESFPSGGLPNSLSILFISNCDKLMARRKEWGLQRLPSLRHCFFMGGECEEEEEDKKLLFPEECLLPTSLTHLIINNRPNLKSLNPSGLGHLNSLESLTIWYCPNLQSLPDEGLPSSLVRLQIEGCPLLSVRCRSGIGEEWPKISHIPSIQLD